MKIIVKSGLQEGNSKFQYTGIPVVRNLFSIELYRINSKIIPKVIFPNTKLGTFL